MKSVIFLNSVCGLMVLGMVLMPLSANAGDTWIEVSCKSALGTFHLAGNTQAGTTSFELEKEGQLLEDRLELCKSRAPCKFELVVKKGGWLQIRAHELVETFVESHYVCRPSRSPIACHNRVWVPEHYEWQERRTIALELSPLAAGQFKTELFFFRGYPVEGLLALGKDAICTVAQSAAADK